MRNSVHPIKLDDEHKEQPFNVSMETVGKKISFNSE